MRRAGGPETGGSNPLSPTNTKGPSSDGPFVLVTEDDLSSDLVDRLPLHGSRYNIKIEN
jgi:hypothetical protein